MLLHRRLCRVHAYQQPTDPRRQLHPTRPTVLLAQADSEHVSPPRSLCSLHIWHQQTYAATALKLRSSVPLPLRPVSAHVGLRLRYSRWRWTLLLGWARHVLQWHMARMLNCRGSSDMPWQLWWLHEWPGFEFEPPSRAQLDFTTTGHMDHCSPIGHMDHGSLYRPNSVFTDTIL
jgi:hypothetical protein